MVSERASRTRARRFASPHHAARDRHRCRAARVEGCRRGVDLAVAEVGEQAGDGQRAAREQGGGDAREPDAEDHGALGALARAAAGDEIEDRSRSDRYGANVGSAYTGNLFTQARVKSYGEIIKSPEVLAKVVDDGMSGVVSR